MDNKEELRKILRAVSLVTNVDSASILHGKHFYESQARKVLHFIVRYSYEHLIKQVVEECGYTSSVLIYKNARDLERVDDSMNGIHAQIAEVYRILRITDTPIKKNKKKGGVSTTKQLFGFDYTEREKVALQRYKNESIMFWSKLCKPLAVL